MRKDVAVPSVVEDIQFKVVKGASEAFAPKSAEMEYAAALVSEVVALETPHHRLLLALGGHAVVVMSPAIRIHDQRALAADLEPLPENVLLAGLVLAEEVIVGPRIS